jgi:ABC-type molybdenum transport system ATPase subunit/photorepair protein PhrA
MREADLLELDADALYRPFCELSNGERTKLLLAGLFLTEDGFFLIDEPTQLYRYLFAVAERAAFVRVLPDDDIRRA